MKIYFTVDSNNRVIPCCDYYEDIQPDADWILGELPDNSDAYEEHCVPLWKYINGEIVHRTDAEIQADIEDLPVPDPTEIEQLQADVDYLGMENEYLEGTVEQQQADIDYLLMLEGEN